MTQPNFIGHPALLGSPSAKFDTTPKTFFIAIKEFELFGRCNIVLTTPEDMRNGRKISNCMQMCYFEGMTPMLIYNSSILVTMSLLSAGLHIYDI